MQIWPAAAKSIRPWHIGMSRISGELVLMTVYVCGRAWNAASSRPWRRRRISNASATWPAPRA